jgi:hypothetical protein
MTIPTPTMRDRRPAQLVIEKLLLEQSKHQPRSARARFFGLSPLASDNVSWYLGALGEIEVGRILAHLPPEWSTFHAIPVGTGDTDIDHVVVGPGGIFTINTKRHSGKSVWVAGKTLMVSGQKQPYIPSSESEANRVTKVLSKWILQLPQVQPLIVLVDPKSLTVREKPQRVQVMDARGLRRWLIKRPQVLGAAELATVTALIDDPTMWRQEEVIVLDDATTFEQLDREVRSARVRRGLWGLGALAAFLIVVWVSYPWFMHLVMAAVTSLFPAAQ